jgi:hypothetical protein
MQTELYFADILQEIYDAKKTGALYVRIVETSEDRIAPLDTRVATRYRGRLVSRELLPVSCT